MRYLTIYKDSISDGPGVRVSVYFAGCKPNKCKAGNCPGCHNKAAQDFNAGQEYTDEIEDYILKLCENPYIAGLTLVGGEPYDQDSEKITKLARRFSEKFSGKCTKKTIWVFTGYEFDQIKDKELSKYIDVAVVGPFIVEQRDISDANRWRGSRNQRVIDLPKSLENGKIIYLEDIPNNE